MVAYFMKAPWHASLKAVAVTVWEASIVFDHTFLAAVHPTNLGMVALACCMIVCLIMKAVNPQWWDSLCVVNASLGSI